MTTPTDDLYDNGHPTIDPKITSQSHVVKCPHCGDYTYIPPYRKSPRDCRGCGGKFNVPGALG